MQRSLDWKRRGKQAARVVFAHRCGRRVDEGEPTADRPPIERVRRAIDVQLGANLVSERERLACCWL